MNISWFLDQIHIILLQHVYFQLIEIHYWSCGGAEIWIKAALCFKNETCIVLQYPEHVLERAAEDAVNLELEQSAQKARGALHVKQQPTC